MRRQVGKLRPFGWLMLKTLLKRGLIKGMFFLEIGYEEELRISKSKLFHSTNADGKKLKKLFLTFNWVINKFRLFLVWYELIFAGIKS